MNREPNVSTKVFFNLPKMPTANHKLRYISFHFWEDDEPADVAWTFAIAGEDAIEILKNYASSMARDTSEDPSYDEYVHAFTSYIGYLYVQRLLLQQRQTTKENAGSETDVKTYQKGANRKPKDPVPAILLPGRARDEEIKLRLRQGQSFLDLASTLQRSRSFISREAKRLLGEHELKTLMKQNKKGKWSEIEIQYLIQLRQQNLTLREITKWLRRTRPSVEKSLRELRSKIFKPTAVEGPQEMPLSLQKSLFDTRLVDIWQGLLQSEMTEKWRATLQEKPGEEWLSAISAGIPGEVKRLLGGLRPPTWGELEGLPPTDTYEAGVYATACKHSLRDSGGQ
ncbi:MAG: hypothetical protein Q9211_005163 [Gyalolechia sp. 1 TL-2023]